MLTVDGLLDFTDCFTDCNSEPIDLSCNYWYQGYCPQSGEMLRLPRTRMSEELARGLMQYLAADDSFDREGKMYGILLVEMASGEQGILKAFSGLLNGCSVVEGWVPPIPGRSRVQGEEARALTQLEAMKQELIALNQLPQRQEYEALLSEFELQLQVLNEQHRNCKQQREQKRQLLSKTLAAEALSIALEQLNQASRLEGIERRQLKRRRDETLQPLKLLIEAADERMRALKQQRKELSRELQAQMHAAYTLVNFFGKSRSLLQLMPAGAIPTGTGDCCAPKLLHYAAANNLKPLAMAEFWWGPSSGDKIQGEFYGACGDRCQPLMGFLLSGLGQNKSKLPIIYQDDWLIAVNKPCGLLSVPGRYFDTQDSVQSRLQNYFCDGLSLKTVHRLDLETSGILLLARDKETYCKLSRQFEKRQVRKVYEAVLSGILKIDAGTIELPLWGNPENRPCQQVNWDCGKPSVTGFQVMAREGNHTRVEFLPLTGRTHQLRVHAADVGGLGIPILGDRLYGCRAQASRLHLHARELCFEHPQSGEWLHLQAATPF